MIFIYLGGTVIFSHAGEDVTDIFTALHSGTASSHMQRFEIGELDETPENNSPQHVKSKKQLDFEEAFRALRRKMISLGYFKPSYTYYTLKLLSNFALLGSSVYLAHNYHSLPVTVFAALLLGFFFQQSFYLQHDALHHQLFKTYFYGELMGLLTGNFFQGFSAQWWKAKHSSHHAVPNVVPNTIGASDGDPDINTMPIFSWTLKMAEQARSQLPLVKVLIKYQAIYYLPFLALSRFIMCAQSMGYAFGGIPVSSVNKNAYLIDRTKMPYPLLEKISLILHHLVYYKILTLMPFNNAVIYYLLAQISGGFLFIIVFGLGHNGMPTYDTDERPDFCKLQVTTTRNITSTPFVDWFCGGLQYQIEHHLFPTMPRHSLKEVHPYVVDFCKEHGIPFYETDMWVGTLEVVRQLDSVAKEFAEHIKEN